MRWPVPDVALVAAVAIGVIVRTGTAQAPVDGRAAAGPRLADTTSAAALAEGAALELGTFGGVRPRAVSGALEATLASAAVPGSGQWLTGSWRWLVYGAAEVGSWLYYLDRRSDGRRLERAYRDLARSIAGGGTGSPSGEPDFEYFEAMADYESSGAYDRDPMRDGVQPETDEATYNGSVWALARAMHGSSGADGAAADSPAYEAALEYYRRHAVPGDLTWTWSGRDESRQRFAGLIERSDAALRNAGRALGVILANHVISAVDAFVSVRLRDGREGASPDVDVRARPDRRTGAVRWSAAVRIGFPRRR